MLEVIVTNEFTHMNAGTERRPFKVLRPQEHSTAMVIARYSGRQPAVRAVEPVDPGDVLWRALRVGALCAACAFAFFFVSQRNLFQRTAQTFGPPPDSVERLQFPAASPSNVQSPAMLQLADAKSVAKPAEPQTFALPDGKNLAVTEFNLSVNPEFQSVGNVELRLTGANPTTKTYDITVRTNAREFYRQDVKLNEHVPLTKSSGSGPELVVGAIAQNRVFGYVSEPQRRGHRRHRRHSN